jgi:hypothetical protein
MLPNWESGPQNQPIANVAVSTIAGAFKSICGIVNSEATAFSSPNVSPILHANVMGTSKTIVINALLSDLSIRCIDVNSLSIAIKPAL